MTVFVTTHYMDEAEYCDRLGLIYRGELIALGTPAELKEAMAEEIVEISCDRPQAALAIVDALPGVRYAALFGRGLHVVTDCAASDDPPDRRPACRRRARGRPAGADRAVAGGRVRLADRGARPADGTGTEVAR